MLQILFNKSTFFFYLLVLISQYLTKCGLFELKNKGQTNLISIANAFNFVAVFYVFYYTYKTTWWAFIALINVAVIASAVLNFLLLNKTSFFKTQMKQCLFVKLVSVSLVFLMFLFLN